MTYTEVLELIRAGYTKVEIDAMIKAEAGAEDHQKAADEPAPEARDADPQEAAAEPEPVKSDVKEESETEKMIKALGLRLDTLTKAVQKSNVNSIEGTKTNEINADDIVAKIINPHYGEEEK